MSVAHIVLGWSLRTPISIPTCTPKHSKIEQTINSCQVRNPRKRSFAPPPTQAAFSLATSRMKAARRVGYSGLRIGRGLFSGNGSMNMLFHSFDGDSNKGTALTYREKQPRPQNHNGSDQTVRHLIARLSRPFVS